MLELCVGTQSALTKGILKLSALDLTGLWWLRKIMRRALIFVTRKILDAAKENIVYSSEKLAPKNLHRRTFKGASQGWYLIVNSDGTLI